MFEDFCLDSINVNGLNGLQTNRHNNLLSSCDYSINSKSYVSSVLKTENFLGNISASNLLSVRSSQNDSDDERFFLKNVKNSEDISLKNLHRID